MAAPTSPLVLISNDDGIGSHYLNELATALERAGTEVLVAAPEKPRSAMSHSITLHKPLRVHEQAPRRYAISGSPVDCVYVALNKLATRPPDLVVSGINDGYNLGSDVFYSGTVGAAVEGGLRGIPGLAISAAPGRKSMREKVEVAAAVVAAALADPMRHVVVNVNIPNQRSGRYQWTRLGQRFYGDDVHERTDPRGRSYIWIGGGDVGMDEVPGTDCHAVARGHVSLTPLSLDRTAVAALDAASRAWSIDGLSQESP